MLKLPEPSPAWQQYVAKGVIDKTVSPIIANSWRRCRTNNLDPLRLEHTESLTGRALDAKMKIYSQLIRISAPIMSELFSRMNDCRGLVVLTDKEGYVLYSLGSNQFTEQAKKIRFTVGSNWGETTRGTNAIGTSLIDQRPIHIDSQEHFCRENHILSCSASPIFDSNGELIGTLDISTYYQDSDPYMLGLAIAAAKTIETQLVLENSRQQSVIAYRQISSMMEMTNDGLLALDRDGIITHINKTGSDLLGLPQKECIGRPLSQLISEAEKWLYELRHGKKLLEKLILHPGQANSSLMRYRMKMLTDEQEQFWGACVSFVKQQSSKTTGVPIAKARYTYEDIIGSSQSIELCKKLVLKAAHSSSTVLLQGESGTGKELFAQAIHNASQRSNEPFVAINMGAIPASLIESELFGYEEGSFTGARKGGQPGKFELANGGTIFLDEIGEMPLNLQVHLLRVLEERQVTRLGGYKPIPLNIRVIAATNRSLQDLIKKDSFRLDLYYRLNVLTIQIPSLQDRKSDIPILANHFIEKLSQQMNKPDMTLSQEAENCLKNYSWPGNVRELQNVIERAMNYAEELTILPHHLPSDLTPSDQLEPEALPLLKDKEMETILSVLQQTNGNLGQAAKLLGIGRTTLYRKLKKYHSEIKEED